MEMTNLTIVSKSNDVFTVEGAVTPLRHFLAARAVAAHISRNKKRSIKIYKNGRLYDINRF